MKFVRWLGAFGSGSSLTEAAAWETKQTERQVAAEPLVRGRSFIDHAKIGLSVQSPEATFRRGWLWDAWTVTREDGTIRATRNRYAEYKNMDRFLSALNKSNKNRDCHAEAAFAAPTYSAVVVKSTATPHGKRRAKRLAAMLGLPLEVLQS